MISCILLIFRKHDYWVVIFWALSFLYKIILLILFLIPYFISKLLLILKWVVNVPLSFISTLISDPVLILWLFFNTLVLVLWEASRQCSSISISPCYVLLKDSIVTALPIRKNITSCPLELEIQADLIWLSF